MTQITIDNLNRRQQVLADIIWACDTVENLDLFISALPTVELRQEAMDIVALMTLAMLEKDVDEDMSAAQSVLAKFTLK